MTTVRRCNTADVASLTTTIATKVINSQSILSMHRLTRTRLQGSSDTNDNGNDGGNTNVNRAVHRSELNLLSEEQIDFTISYINKHFRHIMTIFAEVFTPLGEIKAKKNAFRGGSYEIIDAELVDIEYFGDYGFLYLEATTIQIRGQKKQQAIERVVVPLGESSRV